MSCGDPGDGVGKVTKQSHGYNYNQTVDYACSHGYHDKISAHVAVTLTCLGNGTWSRPAPICIGKDISSIQMFIFFKVEGYITLYCNCQCLPAVYCNIANIIDQMQANDYF